MKIYLVSSGEYSDYGIRKVFLNEENAQKYAKNHSGEYDDEYQVEEWDAVDSDESFTLQEFYYVSACYDVYEDGDIVFKLDVDKTSSADIESELELNDTGYYEAKGWTGLYSGYRKGYNTLYIKRQINGDGNEEKLKDKYLKVCQDTYAKIKYMLEVEGMTKEDVNIALKNASSEAKNTQKPPLKE
jgi:hypothetical protein